ncbi:leukotriene A-4 hydrolase [Schistocerca americana]|uniref:leukotriene A-4 hydrolase n=1 Tax=Schistocerca americana TaxID=7009 RepID=UPI001F4F14A9|nr:leukotriene A-4 hydrolase [Schistocerca americana]
MTKEGLSSGDPNSYSNPDEVAVSHLDVSLTIDFERKILIGEVNLTTEKKKDDAHLLVLDTRELKIKDISDKDTGTKLDYTIDKDDPVFGSKLTVKLPSRLGKNVIVKIEYETSPSASALQWLSPQQTAGGKHPYLFSQCQAIHCRSVIPCQDSPAVKVTYSAQIRAPEDLVVLMSAVRDGEPSLVGKGLKLHKFRQNVPIPSYLFAIAVGALASHRLSPRCQVWSEKEFVDQAAYEFAETEKMLSIAEDICGEYVWGVYDLLVLPPSFPFGGMENPCLTFVTPTVLAGDRSLADVVAHEISHSWTGNLVTNKNFEHFWLNEGFTMFVERKILARLIHPDQRKFSAFCGLKDLRDAINTRGQNDPMTCLVPDLRSVSPDDSFSVVPYEKGHTFLYYLEELAGGPEKFDPFLRAYLEKFKYKSIGTDDFKEFLYEYFAQNADLKKVDWDTWLKKPGMPPVIPDYKTSLEETCTDLCKKWVKWSETESCPFSATDLKNLSSLQVKEFLAQLLEEKPLSLEKLKTMEKIYKLNSVKNSEIRFRWLRLCIRGKWKEQIQHALDFVTEQGRMKFVRPIYRELYAWDEAREAAISSYKAHASSMMYVSAYTVGKDLHLN